MYFDVIKGILRSNLTARRKLAKISELVEKAELVERIAVESASKKGRRPTIDDRLYAMKTFAESRSISLTGVNEDQLIEQTSAGVQWLKNAIWENGGWETGGNFQPYIVEEKPTEPVRPLDMLFLAPWEISLTIYVLGYWLQFFSPEDHEALDLIVRGKRYLRKIQSFFGNGGLGDSLWIKSKRKMAPLDRKSATNVLETCIALYALNQPLNNLSSDNSENRDAIEKGITYLKNIWNEKDGGWGFKKGCVSDIKSTAFSFMVLETLKSAQLSSLSQEEFNKLTGRSLEWILDRQQEDGSWEYQLKSRDSSVFGSFYSIEAIAMKKLLSELSAPGPLVATGPSDERLDMALVKALTWYESSCKFIKDDSGEGWGWEDSIKNSGVENTAASLIVLLDAGWIDEKSHLMVKTVELLLRHCHPKSFWNVNTPLVLMSLIEILKPKTRLCNRIRGQYESYNSTM